MHGVGSSSRDQRVDNQTRPQSHSQQSSESLDPRALLAELTGDKITNTELARLEDLDNGELRNQMSNNLVADAANHLILQDNRATRALYVVVAERCGTTGHFNSQYVRMYNLVYYAQKNLLRNDPNAPVLALALRLLAENRDVTKRSLLYQIGTQANNMCKIFTNEVLHQHAKRAIEAANEKLEPAKRIAFQARTAPLPTSSVPTDQGPHEDKYDLDEFERSVQEFEGGEHDY